MIKIDPAMYPTREQLGLLADFQPGEPVWMVSLQRYRDVAEYPESEGAPITGREAYGRYGEALRPIVEEHGGRVIAVAEMRGLLIGNGEADFDTMTTLEFPDVATWQSVMALDTVKEISRHRVAGLESQVLFLAAPRDTI
jgi:uncharacterized protein (DUF1330 family)